MWAVMLVLYCIPGFITTGFVMAVFPPYPGYNPPWYWTLLATVLCTLLWPMLAILALGYTLGCWYSARKTSRVQRPTESITLGRQFSYQRLFKETRN